MWFSLESLIEVVKGKKSLSFVCSYLGRSNWLFNPCTCKIFFKIEVKFYAAEEMNTVWQISYSINIMC